MKALLLLAGRSRRFWPLREKSLFAIAGKTLLEHQIARMREGGLSDIILVGGKHNLEAAQLLFPDLPIIEQENLELGMQGALLSALPKVGSESVMIVSGNDVVEPSAYRSLLNEASKGGVMGAILGKKVERYFPGGYLTLQDMRAAGIVEKPGEGNEPSNLVNIVAHVHNDASLLLQELQKVQSDRDDGYEVALHHLLQEHIYSVVLYEGFWQAVKYPWHLLELLSAMLPANGKPQIHASCSVHETAVIEGPIVLEEGVKVLPHATIVGPAYVGRNSVIGTNALVRGASIGEHCVIGYNSEIKTSILGHDIWTHSTYLGDSVIGNNVAFGGGTMTGNFRLDEGEILSRDPSSPFPLLPRGESGTAIQTLPTGRTKFGAVIGSDVRIGIQTGINPGVKIGSGTFIGRGVYVTEDIPEKSFVAMKDGVLVVRENKTTVPSKDDREKFRS